MLPPHGDKCVKDVAVGPTPGELVLIRVWRRIILPLLFLVPFSHRLFSNQGSAVVKRCSRSAIELSSCLFSPSQTQGSVPAKKNKKAPFPPLALSFLHRKDRKLNSVVHRGCLSLCDPRWQHVLLWWRLFLNPRLFRHIAFFHANDSHNVQCLLSRACLCWPDVTFRHSLDVRLSVSASDGGSCRTSRPWWILKFFPEWSRSDVARRSQLDVLSWPRPSSSEERSPWYPWRGSPPPTHPPFH